MIALGGFEEPDTVVVSVAHQAGKLRLAQFALHASAELVPVPKARRVTFTLDLPSFTQSLADRLCFASAVPPAVESTEAATPVFRKSRLLKCAMHPSCLPILPPPGGRR
jgi:hypothetical protein